MRQEPTQEKRMTPPSTQNLNLKTLDLWIFFLIY